MVHFKISYHLKITENNRKYEEITFNDNFGEEEAKFFILNKMKYSN